MKKLLSPLFCIAIAFTLASCGGKSDAELGAEAAEFYCQQVAAEKAGDETGAKAARDKMNKIRKPYMVGDKNGTDAAKVFNDAFAAAKKAKGCD